MILQRPIYSICKDDIDGLVQDYNISIGNTLEILQSCTKPSTWRISTNEIPCSNFLGRVVVWTGCTEVVHWRNILWATNFTTKVTVCLAVCLSSEAKNTQNISPHASLMCGITAQNYSIEYSPWINVYIKLWDIIIHPCLNFNVGLLKPMLKLGYGWVITSTELYVM